MDTNHTLIIAEAGVNHNGDINLAKELINIAADAGADIVKFQTFKADSLASKKAKKARYQIENTSKNESQVEMLNRLELSKKMHQELISYCKLKKIDFFSSAFDIESLKLLKSLGLNYFKIPSGEITNLPYLKLVGSFAKPIIMSTGMATIDEIKDAMNILEISGTSKQDITILHCNTEYPTPLNDVNLKAMTTIKDIFNVNVGYSDHTLGIEIAIAAVALGAKVIEKHFTIDRNLKGPDHKASLEPQELNQMIKSIRNIEKAIGDGVKRPSASEINNKLIVRKSLVASKFIKAGELFSVDNVTSKRPGTGISPMKFTNIIGKIAKKNFEKDDLIEL
jgi:N,N'-diacetyllegionaminate synthase